MFQKPHTTISPAAKQGHQLFLIRFSNRDVHSTRDKFPLVEVAGSLGLVSCGEVKKINKIRQRKGNSRNSRK